MNNIPKSAIIYTPYQIAIFNGRVHLITVTLRGRYDKTLASILNSYEGNVFEALQACYAGDEKNGIRIFLNKP